MVRGVGRGGSVDDDTVNVVGVPVVKDVVGKLCDGEDASRRPNQRVRLFIMSFVVVVCFDQEMTLQIAALHWYL